MKNLKHISILIILTITILISNISNAASNIDWSKLNKALDSANKLKTTIANNSNFYPDSIVKEFDISYKYALNYKNTYYNRQVAKKELIDSYTQRLNDTMEEFTALDVNLNSSQQSLRTAINRGNAILYSNDKSKYVGTSITKLENAVKAGENYFSIYSVAAKNGTIQDITQQASTLATTINNAINNLQERENWTELDKSLEAARRFKAAMKKNYSEGLTNEFTSKYTEIENYKNNYYGTDYSNQIQIDAYVQQLNSIMRKFTELDTNLDTNRKDLRTAMNSGNTILNSEDKAKYTDTSIRELEARVKAGEEYLNPNAGENGIIEDLIQEAKYLAKAINNAINNLKEKANWTRLEEILKVSNELKKIIEQNPGYFPNELVTEFDNNYKEATIYKNVYYNTDDFEQAKINDLAQKLNDMILTFKNVNDKYKESQKVLKDAITRGNEIILNLEKKAKYIETSVKALEEAVKIGENYFNNSQIGENKNIVVFTKEATDITKAIINTIENLEKVAGKKAIVNTQKEKDNYANATIDITADEILSTIPLTAEEEEYIGETEENIISIYIEVNETSLSNKEKGIVEQAIPSDIILGKILDISLYKKVGENEEVQIKEIPDDKKIKITMNLQDDLLPGGDFNRISEFFVYRIHNGKIELVESNLDIESKTISFYTDKFSTYMLSYRDTENGAYANNQKIGIYIVISVSALIILAIAVIAFIIIKKRFISIKKIY